MTSSRHQGNNSVKSHWTPYDLDPMTRQDTLRLVGRVVVWEMSSKVKEFSRTKIRGVSHLN